MVQVHRLSVGLGFRTTIGGYRDVPQHTNLGLTSSYSTPDRSAALVGDSGQNGALFSASRSPGLPHEVSINRCKVRRAMRKKMPFVCS